MQTKIQGAFPAFAPPGPLAAEGESPPLGVYVHVPFCASTCDFCAFYQEQPHRADLDRYLDGIERELELLGPVRPADTIFWGGGTPSVLPARDIERLGRMLASHFGAAVKEWSVEMAPSSVRPDKLDAMRAAGVTRVSMGVQSFLESTLAALGRRHSPAQVYEAITAIREVGFENWNLDLMFAIPGQTPEAWRADLEEAVRLQPAHLSTYCLTFEEDTAMWLKLARGQVRPDAEIDAERYEMTWDFLEDAGYAQYEISNFARPGRECRHNLDTWHMAEWVGLGPSAASQFRGRRYANPPDLEKWRAGVESGTPEYLNVAPLTPALLAADSLIFGLRLNRGVSLAALHRRFPEFDFGVLEPLWTNLRAEGLMEADEKQRGQLRLTRAGRLVADRVGAAILEVV